MKKKDFLTLLLNTIGIFLLVFLAIYVETFLVNDSSDKQLFHTDISLYWLVILPIIMLAYSSITVINKSIRRKN